jgi:hypothetical protein
VCQRRKIGYGGSEPKGIIVFLFRFGKESSDEGSAAQDAIVECCRLMPSSHGYNLCPPSLTS